MKRNSDDIEFAKLLKQNTPEVSQNPWFTRKVVNRLPDKNQPSMMWGYILELILCLIVAAAAWWIYFTKLNMDVITVRDILTFIFMTAGTAAFASLPVLGILKKSDEI